jgi:hypothetical protein
MRFTTTVSTYLSVSRVSCCCSYCAPALASSAYALALLRYRPPRSWVQSLLLETQRQMPAFGAQELSNLVWALAVLDIQPGAAWFRDFQVQVGSVCEKRGCVRGSCNLCNSERMCTEVVDRQLWGWPTSVVLWCAHASLSSSRRPSFNRAFMLMQLCTC